MLHALFLPLFRLLVFERLKTFIAEARRRNGGRLHILWAGAPPRESKAAVAASGSLMDMSNPLPNARVNAEPKAPASVPASLLRVVLESQAENCDLVMLLVFSASLLIGASVIMRAPNIVS